MRMQLVKQLAACLILATSIGLGCAGGSLNQVGGGTELPKEVSSDLKERYEVKDSLTLGPQPIPTPSLDIIFASGNPEEFPSKKTLKKKKKLKKEPQVSSDVLPTPLGTPTAAPFTYVSRRPSKDPIWVGEKMIYEMTYFGMLAGDLTLEILPYKAIDRRKVYHVKASATSSSVFSLFYRLNDTVETFVDYDGVFSHRFHLALDESKQMRDSLEINDSVKAQTFFWNRWNHKDRGYTETKEFAPIPPFAQDSLSALYYLRTVPLPDGAVITFPVVSEGKTWDAIVTVVRREMMDTPLGRVQTVVLKPETKYQGVLQKKGDTFLWLTDDDRRYCVRLEAKVRIGTVVANLKKVIPGTPPAVP